MSTYSGIVVSDPRLDGLFTQVELRSFKNKFDSLKTGNEAILSREDMKAGYFKIGFQNPLTDSQIDDIVEEFGSHDIEGLDFEGFLRFQLDLSKSDSKYKALIQSSIDSEKRDFMRSSISSSLHRINDSERRAYVEHINKYLSEDKHVKKFLPINTTNNDVFEIIKDGILLCKLINIAVPKTIDERAINLKEHLNPWEKSENHTLCLHSLKAIGCSVVNVGTQDLVEGRAHLVLGLIAQLVKIQLLSVVNVEKTPELAEIVNENEGVEELVKLSSETILLRWMNYHLKKANFHKEIKNFSSDLKDGEAYSVLLHQLAPEVCEDVNSQSVNGIQKAENILAQAEKIDCAKYIQAKDLVEGSHDLNLAFVANLFQTRNGLTKKKVVKKEIIPEIVESTEERMYRMWINSVGISTHVFNLIEDIRDGFVLLEVFDKIAHGSVNWKLVNKPPIKLRIKKIENCNQVLQIGREIDLSIINVVGSDFVDGNKKLILGFLGQLMRYHMLLLLMQLRKNHKVSENDILNWANEMLESAGKETRITSFKEKSLSTGLFFLDLLSAIDPNAIDQNLITPGENDEEKQQNANYIISVARKMGCSIFIVPNDIVEGRSKMIFTLVASIMLYYLTHKEGDKSAEKKGEKNGEFSFKSMVKLDTEGEISITVPKSDAFSTPSALTPRSRRSFASITSPIRAFVKMSMLKNSPSPNSFFKSSISSPNIATTTSNPSSAPLPLPTPPPHHSPSDPGLSSLSRPKSNLGSKLDAHFELDADFKAKMSLLDDDVRTIEFVDDGSSANGVSNVNNSSTGEKKE